MVFKLHKPSQGYNGRKAISLLDRFFPMQLILMASLTRMVVVAMTKLPLLSYCCASNRRVFPIFHIIWWRLVLHWRVTWDSFLSTCSISARENRKIHILIIPYNWKIWRANNFGSYSLPVRVEIAKLKYYISPATRNNIMHAVALGPSSLAVHVASSVLACCQFYLM